MKSHNHQFQGCTTINTLNVMTTRILIEANYSDHLLLFFMPFIHELISQVQPLRHVSVFIIIIWRRSPVSNAQRGPTLLHSSLLPFACPSLSVVLPRTYVHMSLHRSEVCLVDIYARLCCCENK